MFVDGELQRHGLAGSDDARGHLASDGVGAERGEDVSWIFDHLAPEADEQVPKEDARAVGGSSWLDPHDHEPGLRNSSGEGGDALAYGLGKRHELGADAEEAAPGHAAAREERRDDAIDRGGGNRERRAAGEPRRAQAGG